MPPRRTPSAALSYADTLSALWFALDAFTHLAIEGSYLALALGQTAAKSSSLFGAIWREYGNADRRWAGRDPTVISLELLTVFGGGPAAAALVYAIVKCVRLREQPVVRATHRVLRRRKPWRHLVQALLSLAELYGGWMTFAPEWVEGSPNLVSHKESLLRFWVHLVFMNGLWVLIPLVLLAESCVQIVRACDKAKTPAAGTALSAGWFHLCSLSLLAYAVLIPLIVGAIAMGKL